MRVFCFGMVCVLVYGFRRPPVGGRAQHTREIPVAHSCNKNSFKYFASLSLSPPTSWMWTNLFIKIKVY